MGQPGPSCCEGALLVVYSTGWLCWHRTIQDMDGGATMPPPGEMLSPSTLGIAGITRGKLVLSNTPDVPPAGSLRYALGFPFQADPQTVGLMVMRQTEETANYGFLDGSDVVLLRELTQPDPAQVVVATRNEMDDGTYPPNLLLKSPLMGGFVPRGALRADGVPHPHAGTGFGIAQAQRFPFCNGRFSWGDPGRLDLLEIFQLAYDGTRFSTQRTAIFPQNVGEPMRIGDSAWAFLATGLSNAIPDGDDLLLAVLAARLDRSAVGIGVVRWVRLDGNWQPTVFDPVLTDHRPVPHGPNPMEQCPWMEPSLARDEQGRLLFAVRRADSFQQANDTGQGYRLCLWGSTRIGEWTPVIDNPEMRLNAPVTVNVMADGTPYLVSNPYDSAFIPETNATGRGREKLVLWPVDMRQGRLDQPWLIRDCLTAFGAPPSAGEPEFWMADHPNGLTVRLQDGCWHHLLVSRVCHCPRYRPSNSAPSPYSGCWIDEVASRGIALPIWRFMEDR